MGKTDTVEKWLPISGWEGRYEVSNHGRVRGIGPRSRGVLSQYVRKKSGHRTVGLHVLGTKRQKNRTVHSLVAEAFIGPRPVGMVWCHNDGDPANNHEENLRADTPAGNSADMVAHGRSLPGQRNGFAKLSDAEAREIKAMKGTARYRDIAFQFGVSFATVQKIMSGGGWTHV